MSAALLLGITGLALLDSLNPATIGAVALIVLAAPRRPGLTALAAVLGAAVTVFTVGAILFLAAGAAASAVGAVVAGIRYVAFAAAGVALVVAGIRRFRSRPRRPIGLPTWFTAWTALPFGAVITAADLPNAFPYFIAIERLIAAGATTGEGLAVIAGYTLIYCLPCLILLVVALAARTRTRAFLERLIARFGSGEVPRSPVIGILLIVLGLVAASLPFWLLAP